MGIIKNWIVCVLIGAFIVNIVDMILPKSKLKPYINLVCNFIFVFIVISPIAGFFSEKNSLEDKILKYMTEYNQKYVESSTQIFKENKSLDLDKEYENNLKSVIELKLDEYGYELEDIDLNGTDIKSLKVKEKDKNLNQKDSDEKEVFNNNIEEEKSIKDDLIKILEVSIDKIEID